MGIYYNISAPAKLNLNLIVKNNRFKGLHFIESDICFLELADKIFLKFSEQDMFFQNNNKGFMINPKNNLILKALEKFRSFTKWDKKFEIVIL